MTPFGAALRHARLGADLSQRELAERVGVDHTYLSKVENGRMPPPARATIEALARACQADADPLLALAGKPRCRCAELRAERDAFLAACTRERDGIPAPDWLAAVLTEVDAHFKVLAGDDPQALYAALGVSSRLLRELRAAVAKVEGRES